MGIFDRKNAKISGKNDDLKLDDVVLGSLSENNKNTESQSFIKDVGNLIKGLGGRGGQQVYSETSSESSSVSSLTTSTGRSNKSKTRHDGKILKNVLGAVFGKSAKVHIEAPRNTPTVTQTNKNTGRGGPG